MLTPRQNELLTYIHQRQHNDGITPSFEEMRLALKLKSKSGIHQLITALIHRGYIERLANRSRALKILQLPAHLHQTSDDTRIISPVQTLSPSVQPPSVQPPHQTQAYAVTPLPFLGRIAAGLAIEAIEYNDAIVDVPQHLVGHGEHYVLEITGDSMTEAGILDGDQVIIRHQQTAHNGDIVVACIDQDEVTLKRWQRRGDSVALHPENSQYQTQIYGADRVSVKGVLAGLIRQY